MFIMCVQVKRLREIKKYNPKVIKCFLKPFFSWQFQNFILNKAYTNFTKKQIKSTKRTVSAIFSQEKDTIKTKRELLYLKLLLFPL